MFHTAGGAVRRAGFELEYAGPDVDASAGIVRDIFGGEIETVNLAVRKVRNTRVGDFSVEIDSSLLKDKRYEAVLRAVGLSPESIDTEPLERLLAGVLSAWVPFEIATPPIPIDTLYLLDELRGELRTAGAKGTRASFRYAFGMHINPELPSENPASVRDHLRAYFLLEPWLRERVDVDLTRRVMPFINSFPSEYARLILQEDYPGDIGSLIDDYLKYNPTRNRPLDVLPVLAHLDGDRVMSQVEDPHLVKARPAYHYRLPNCLIDEPDWRLAREWNTWVAVERLAADAPALAAMSRDYLEADSTSFRPFVDKWPSVLEGYMAGGVG
ncbi:amidoligase family protein [Humisphaera borealis]|uniref:Amidoligase family protein n=1 Tax=Humisphaera borealis TaxID=2807512 RepID=A0A7M2WQW3_9BACT|nr:amidoligase family protein [Humisphaera borealis]QOV87927.1 amidoligase family protein [Humisphaera borealis]